MSEREMIHAAGKGGGEPAEQRTVGGRFARAHHILLYFLGAAIAIWLLTGFYQVKEGEVAIVERLGQYIATPEGRALPVGHGLHYHLPWPIDRVHVISVQQQLTMTVKAFNASPAEYDDFKRMYLTNPNNPFANMRPELAAQAVNAIFNPYLITADKSVVHMEIAVFFGVSDPEQWLQSVSHDYHETYDPDAKGDMRNELLQQIAQRALISQAARMRFDEMLLTKRDQLPRTLQERIDSGMTIQTVDPDSPQTPAEVKLGIKVLAVGVTVVRPPDSIKGAFENVLNQLLSKDTLKATAQSDANSMLVKANGEKSTLEANAEAYKEATIKAAQGEADRFSQVLTQFYSAPDVTRWNLFVEAATTVTGNAKRIFSPRPGDKIWIEVPPPEYDANQAKSATGE